MPVGRCMAFSGKYLVLEMVGFKEGLVGEEGKYSRQLGRTNLVRKALARLSLHLVIP